MKPLLFFVLAFSAAACLLAQPPAFTEDFESGKLDPKTWDQKIQAPLRSRSSRTRQRTASTHCKSTIRKWLRRALRF